MSRLRKRGWGPWKSEWYSICSTHYYYIDTCHMCTCGRWINTWWHFLGHIVYKVSPDFWRYIVNKPWWRKLFKTFQDTDLDYPMD